MNSRINVFIELGKRISKLLNTNAQDPSEDSEAYNRFQSVISRSYQENQWFTKTNIILAFKGIVRMLNENSLSGFMEKYAHETLINKKVKRVGVIMAGNIPMAGFHDLMCVLLSGNKLIAKVASDDKVLIPYIIEQLIAIDPLLEQEIQITGLLKDFDAVIATGSNNSARYFEYYFGKYPHIIRKNRNGVAILDGTETKEEILLLGNDIFTYFGLGCRNVSKLYVPINYNFNQLFENIRPFGDALLHHNKYLNNYDYHNALFLLEKIPFLTNNFLIIKENESYSTPVSVLNYEYYADKNQLINKLICDSDKIQCTVGNKNLNIENPELRVFNYGEAQQPEITDFADGVDTMAFLVSLN